MYTRLKKTGCHCHFYWNPSAAERVDYPMFSSQCQLPVGRRQTDKPPTYRTNAKGEQFCQFSF